MGKKLAIALVSVAVLVLALASSSLDASQAAEPQPGGVSRTTVWNGVYTQDQVKRGLAEYEANCMGSHKAQLDSINPESRLQGRHFMERWREDRWTNCQP